MADPTPLIVPIPVEALVVNDSLRQAGGGWVRVDMQYQNLGRAGSAEPTPLNTDRNFTSGGMVGAVPASQYYDGVYLKWRLPDALTHGVQDSQTGDTDFPVLPNRWLVVRGGGTPAAWVVESDYVWPRGTQTPQNAGQVGSMYLAPPAQPGGMPRTVRIGRNVPLAGGGWTEPGTSLGLTAMAPGNPGFTAYQPASNNVFSMIDPLHGVAAQSFSYLVVGWYGVPAEDRLATLLKDEGFADALAELDWSVLAGTDPTATATYTLYSGFVTGVAWQETAVPAGGAPTSPISVAVGDTSVQALTALVGQQAAALKTPVDAELFEAFQLDLLATYDQPDGPAQVAARVHDSGFQLGDGGYGWEVVDAPGVTTPATPAEVAAEEGWLAALNTAQSTLDEARRTLAGLQDQLYVMWWKYQYWANSLTPPPASGFTQKDVAAQLDPNVAGSLARQVAQQAQRVSSLAAGPIPTGDTPAELDAAIAAFAAKQGLPATRQLKRTGLPRFALTNNPVVLLAGTGSMGIAGSTGTLPVRFASQEVTGLTVGGKEANASTPSLAFPIPDLSGVVGAPWTADLIAGLAREMYFLDAGSAPAIATALGVDAAAVTAAQADPASRLGTAPANTGTAWNGNPWRPLYLFWQTRHYPIAYGPPSAPTWTFDGTGYRWTGSGAASTPLVLGGRIMLAPTAAFNLRSRVQQMLDSSPNMDAAEAAAFKALLDFVESNDAWDLLSQALDGFNEQLLLRGNGATLSPSVGLAGLDPSVPTLVGNAAGRAPALGGDNFQPWRSGQFYFQSLSVVDEWGQALTPVTQQNYQNVRIFKPAELTPTTSVLPTTPTDMVQLQPRMLQAGRLRFDLLSAADDTKVMGLAPDVNPICGWVLPNHLDRGVSAYAADGTALGELAVGINTSDQAEVSWTAAPGSPYGTLAQLAAGPPHFGPFLAALAAAGPANFNAFLAAIDETLWTTLPMGASFDRGLSVLVGRPLAMVRASLGFQINGPPATDPNWAYTLKPAPPAFTGYTFPVELGNVARLEDGLIGYFTDAAGFGTFNVVQQAGATPGGYLKPIGVNDNYVRLPYDGQTVAYVSMLVDPRAGVHATTGILPTAQAALPPRAVSDAMAEMAVTFRVGPALTDQRVDAPVDGEPGVVTVRLPVPSLKNGTWTWEENEGGTWMSYPTAAPDASAQLSNVAPVLRRGLLKLTNPAL